MTPAGEHSDVFKHLSMGLKQMGKATQHSNTLKREEIALKEKEDKKKKDRIKDMHLSISNMICMASATDLNHIGKFCESFKLSTTARIRGTPTWSFTINLRTNL
jgi:hypothetical protein